jgi:hypothetical protein
MAKTVPLTLINDSPGIPAQVTVMNFAMAQFARTVLSGGTTSEVVAVPPGRYIVSIDRQDLPSEQRVEIVERAHQVRIGTNASEAAATWAATARSAAAARLKGIGGSGTRALASLSGFSDAIGFIKGLGPIHADGLPVAGEGARPQLHVRRGASYGGSPYDRARMTDRNGRLVVRARFPREGERTDPEARVELPLAMLSWPAGPGKALVLALPLFHRGVEIDLRDGLPVDLKPTDDEQSGLASLLDTLAADVPLDPDAVSRSSLGGLDNGERNEDLGEEQLDSVAFRLLRDKFFDPYAAALAGHFLLRFHNFDRVSSWTRNLADYFPYLSDGCVLEGWRRLLGGRKSNTRWPDWRIARPPPPGPRNPEPNAPRPGDPIEDAARRFAEATARGRPVFYYGISRLMDGLYFCLDRLGEGELKQRMRADIETVSAWRRGCFSLGGVTALEMDAAELSSLTELRTTA